jgi:hypothetical protein
MKKKTWLVMGMVGVLLLSGCGAKANDLMTESAVNGGGYFAADMADGDYFYSKSEAPEMEYVDSATSRGEYGSDGSGFGLTDKVDGGETELYNTESEKLIRTVTMQIQTKEFDNVLSYLDAKVAEFGGYIQSSQIYGNGMDSYGYRSASMTLRIPQSKLDLFVAGVDETATVVRKSENAENITLRYADTEARLKSLQIEQERFLALLEKADTVESILVLEEHLTELRYEIESYASTLKLYDNKVNYSTVTLDISEVKRIVPVEQDPTLFSRMKDGFADTWYDIKDSLADFAVWFVSNFLYLVIWAVVIVAAIVVVKKINKSRKAKRAAIKTDLLPRQTEEQNDGMDTEE